MYTSSMIPEKSDGCNFLTQLGMQFDLLYLILKNIISTSSWSRVFLTLNCKVVGAGFLSPLFSTLCLLTYSCPSSLILSIGMILGFPYFSPALAFLIILSLDTLSKSSSFSVYNPFSWSALFVDFPFSFCLSCSQFLIFSKI